MTEPRASSSASTQAGRALIPTPAQTSLAMIATLLQVLKAGAGVWPVLHHSATSSYNGEGGGTLSRFRPCKSAGLSVDDASGRAALPSQATSADASGSSRI